MQLAAPIGPVGPPPRLDAGVELLGTYEDSGFREPRYLVRRSDGQVVQLSRLLYLVASCLDMDADVAQISRYVSDRLGRDVSPDNVTYLIDRKLRPTGIVSTPGSAGPASRANPLLGLKLRLPVVPERVHGGVTGALQPLFRAPIVVAVVVAVLALDAWLFISGKTSLATAVQEVIYRPGLLLAITALTVVMGAFHETGHATAARYGGATPGAMGAGVYLVWPVFYTDVTDAYRLDRRGRLRTDLGGIYFNLVFTLVTAAIYGATGEGLFLAMVLLTQVETLRQFLPFVRLDGYYIVADLAGVPNLFPYLRPALTTAVRFRQGLPRHALRTRPLRALTRRARAVLTVWACVTFPILVVNVVAFVVLAPRIAGTAWGAAGLQARAMSAAVDRADLVGVLNGAVGLVTLALPAAGVAYIVVRVAAKVPAIAATAWRRSAAATGVVVTIAGLLLAYQVVFVWPDTFAASAAPPATSEAPATPAPTVPPGGAEPAQAPAATPVPGRSATSGPATTSGPTTTPAPTSAPPSSTSTTSPAPTSTVAPAPTTTSSPPPTSTSTSTSAPPPSSSTTTFTLLPLPPG